MTGIMPVPGNFHITVLRPLGIKPPAFYVADAMLCRMMKPFEKVFELRISALSAFVGFCLPKAVYVQWENGKSASEFTVSILHSAVL